MKLPTPYGMRHSTRVVLALNFRRFGSLNEFAITINCINVVIYTGGFQIGWLLLAMDVINDKLRLEAFEMGIGSLNDKYFLTKPIHQCFEVAYTPRNEHRRIGLYFKEDVNLLPDIKKEIVEIFLKYFPEPEGVCGLF